MTALDIQVGGDHYKKLKIQPMQYSMANGLDACQHTVIKYTTRFRDKGGIADLEKAIHTLQMLIEFEKEAAMPNKERNYKREWELAKQRGEGEDNATRHRARYAMEKAGKVSKNDGKDVGHKTAIKRGGTNSPSNLEVQTKSENRSFARKSDGSMKSERSKREK